MDTRPRAAVPVRYLSADDPSTRQKSSVTAPICWQVYFVRYFGRINVIVVVSTFFNHIQKPTQDSLIHFILLYNIIFEYCMLYGALVVTLWTCYGALQIVVLLLLLLLFSLCPDPTKSSYETPGLAGMDLSPLKIQ